MGGRGLCSHVASVEFKLAVDDVAVFGVADIEDEAVGAEVEFEVIIVVEGGVEIGG